MKRAFFWVLLLIFGYAVALTQETEVKQDTVLQKGTSGAAPANDIDVPQDVKAGKLEVAQRKWDFGFIPRGAKVTHNFLLKNAGNDTLKITNVRKSCGCTAAPLRKTVLTPGDTTLLEVTFSSGSYQGQVSKAVYVESNDPIEPFLDITFLANVSIPSKGLSFDPFFVKFDTLRSLPAKAVIKVVNQDSQTLSYTIAEQPFSFVNLKARKKKLAPGKETEIEVTLSKAPPSGEFGTSFTLVCDDQYKSRFSIPIQGFYLPPK